MRGLGWAKGVGEFATRELAGFNYKQPPWSVKYPELLNLLEDEPLAPKGNVMARNICWGGPWGWTEPKAQPFIKFENNLVETDPRFLGVPPADFQLADDSPAIQLGFCPIPWDKIGVYAERGPRLLAGRAHVAARAGRDATRDTVAPQHSTTDHGTHLGELGYVTCKTV